MPRYIVQSVKDHGLEAWYKMDLERIIDHSINSITPGLFLSNFFYFFLAIFNLFLLKLPSCNIQRKNYQTRNRLGYHYINSVQKFKASQIVFTYFNV